MKQRYTLLKMVLVFLISMSFLNLTYAAVEIMEAPTELASGDTLYIKLNITNVEGYGKRNVMVTLRIGEGDVYMSTFHVDIDRKSSLVVDKTLEIFKDQEPGLYTIYVDVQETTDAEIHSSKANLRITEPKYDTSLIVSKLKALEYDRSGFDIRSEITISDIPEIIYLGMDERKYFTLTIENSGETELTDIILFPEGKLSMILNSDGRKVAGLMPYESYSLPFFIEVDKNQEIEPGLYSLQLNFISKQTEGEAIVTVQLFNSKRERYNFLINIIENRIIETTERAMSMENVTASTRTQLLSQIQKLEGVLRELSVYFEVGNYEKIQVLFVNSNTLLNEVKAQLDYLEKNPSVEIPFYMKISFYIIVVCAIVLIGVGILAQRNWKTITHNTSMGYFYLFNREKFEEVEHRDVIAEEDKILKSQEEVEYEKLLKIINDQMERGLISKKNHDELKGIYTKKLDGVRVKKK